MFPPLNVLSVEKLSEGWEKRSKCLPPMIVCLIISSSSSVYGSLLLDFLCRQNSFLFTFADQRSKCIHSVGVRNTTRKARKEGGDHCLYFLRLRLFTFCCSFTWRILPLHPALELKNDGMHRSVTDLPDFSACVRIILHSLLFSWWWPKKLPSVTSVETQKSCKRCLLYSLFFSSLLLLFPVSCSYDAMMMVIIITEHENYLSFWMSWPWTCIQK